MYRCGNCGKTFAKRSLKCPKCNSEGITLVAGPRGGPGLLGTLFLLIILSAGAAGVLGYLGFINIPGLTPNRSTPEVHELKPSPEVEHTEKPAAPSPEVQRSRAPEPAKSSAAAEGASKVEKLGPAASASAASSAQALYAKGDFAGVVKMLDGIGSPPDAVALLRKARLLDAVTKRIPKSALATATKLELVTGLGKPMLGVVTRETDTSLTIVMPGGIDTTLKKDDVVERAPAGRDALLEKLRARLKDKEARLKADDSLSLFRLGHYCWQYAMYEDGVPYLDRSVMADDFPSVCAVFGGPDAPKLAQGWAELTGKAVAGPPPSVDAPDSTPAGPAKRVAEPVVNQVGAAQGDVATRARAKYEQGLAQYRLSYGDTKEASAAHQAAFKLFKEARDILNDSDDPKLEDLRLSVQRVLEDCRKRPM